MVRKEKNIFEVLCKEMENEGINEVPTIRDKIIKHVDGDRDKLLRLEADINDDDFMGINHYLVYHTTMIISFLALIASIFFNMGNNGSWMDVCYFLVIILAAVLVIQPVRFLIKYMKYGNRRELFKLVLQELKNDDRFIRGSEDGNKSVKDTTGEEAGK